MIENDDLSFDKIFDFDSPVFAKLVTKLRGVYEAPEFVRNYRMKRNSLGGDKVNVAENMINAVIKTKYGKYKGFYIILKKEDRKNP